MEKRGYIDPGWTPPADESNDDVPVVPAEKPRQKTLDELDRDFAKQAAQRIEKSS